MAKEGKDNSKDLIKVDDDSNTTNVSNQNRQNNNELTHSQERGNTNPIQHANTMNKISEYGGRVKDTREENAKEDKNEMGYANIDRKYEFLSESTILENKNLIYPDDPRGSVDFGGHNGRQDPHNASKHPQENFMNKTQYDPNLYNRRNDYYGRYEDMNASKSIYNPSMSTMRFIAEIDLRCDDHLNRLKEDFQADRYCAECKVLCCDSCVIEFHNQHIQAAKVRVEEYFKKQKVELEDLKSKMNVSIKQKAILSELNLTMDIHEKNISTYFLRRRSLLETLRGKIESLLADENDLYNKLKENIHTFYQDECFRRMEKPLRETESLLYRLQNFLRDWDGFSRTDKARAIKNDQITNFKLEANELNETVKNSVETFKNKSKMLEKNLDEILKLFAYNDKIQQIETILFDISGKVKSSLAQINKLNFEDIIVDEAVVKAHKEELEQRMNMNRNRNMNMNMDMNNNSKMSNSFSLISDNKEAVPQNNMNYPQISQNFPYPSQNNNNIPNHPSANNNPNMSNQSQFNYVPSNYNYQQQSIFINKVPQNNNLPSHADMIPINPNSNILHNANYPSFSMNQQVNPHPFFEENKNNYDLLIGIKPKSDELVVYDAKQKGFVTLKLQQYQFQDRTKAFQTYPDNCRYINLGFSILVTGGYIKKEMTSNCYLIVLCKKDVVENHQEPYDVSIMPYANMIEARDRHNIINLYDRNMILVCSGFFNSNVEVTDVNAGSWKQLAKMNDVRANATVAYINKRYVWVIGGFKINEKQTGVYQNSCEVLDLNLPNQWTLIDFGKLSVNNLKLSAMGVINIHENSILVCGGYDGTQYKKDVYKVDVFEKDLLKVEKYKASLPGNYIFLHNNFIRVDNQCFNFDLQMNVVIFDPYEENFQLQNFKK